MKMEDYLLNFTAELGNAAIEIAAKYEDVTILEFLVCFSTATIGILEQISGMVGKNKKDVVFDFADKLKDTIIHSDDYLLS